MLESGETDGLWFRGDTKLLHYMGYGRPQNGGEPDSGEVGGAEFVVGTGTRRLAAREGGFDRGR